MPEAALLSMFVVAALIVLFSPGPAVLYIVTRSVTQGRKAGLVSSLGLGVGNLVHVVASALGLSALLAASAPGFRALQYAGAAYLIYLGCRRLFSAAPQGRAADVHPESLRRVFRDGVVVNALNPKSALFLLAFLPQFVDARGDVGRQALALGLLFVAMGVLTDSGWALAAGSAGRWLRRHRWYARAERYLSGSVFIGLGVGAALAGGGRK